MPIPQALVTRFFQFIINNQFAEAEKELELIKQKMHKTEWNRGYFKALYGMLLAKKSNGNSNSYSFLAKLDLGDKRAINAYRREFLAHVRNKLHGDFDRGFFAAWAEFMRVLSKMNIETAITEKISSAKVEGELPESGESYDDMEEFLE
jgi:hypothetical protein